MRLSKESRITKLAIEILGWILIVVGLAALVLPGPGLLALFAGMALLATRYEWAERRLEPIQKAALKAASDSVASVPRIIISGLGVATLITLGILCGIGIAVPNWWPLSDALWLPGGWGTGASLIASGLIAAAMVVYSYLNFRNR